MLKPSAAVAAVAILLSLPACSAPPPGEGAVNDPLEPANRRVHAFNRGIDRVAFRPASEVYGSAAPEPLKQGVSNFAGNMSLLGYVMNDALQGEAEDAGHNFFRFLINSTLGVAGVFDPATSFGLAGRESDFGETLHQWGAREGAYVVLPVLGPSTERDAAGTAVDFALNPLRALIPAESRPVVTASFVADGLGERYALRTTIDQILYESADSYAQTRDIYLQNRRFELSGGQPEDYFDPYEDILQ